jgi:hypothetical protein
MMKNSAIEADDPFLSSLVTPSSCLKRARILDLQKRRIWRALLQNKHGIFVFMVTECGDVNTGGFILVYFQ